VCVCVSGFGHQNSAVNRNRCLKFCWQLRCCGTRRAWCT